MKDTHVRTRIEFSVTCSMFPRRHAPIAPSERGVHPLIGLLRATCVEDQPSQWRSSTGLSQRSVLERFWKVKCALRGRVPRRGSSSAAPPVDVCATSCRRWRPRRASNMGKPRRTSEERRRRRTAGTIHFGWPSCRSCSSSSLDWDRRCIPTAGASCCQVDSRHWTSTRTRGCTTCCPIEPLYL